MKVFTGRKAVRPDKSVIDVMGVTGVYPRTMQAIATSVGKRGV